MKLRVLFVTGAAAAMAIVPLAAHATGPNSGDCTANSAPAPSGQTQTLPDGGTVWIDQAGGSGGIEGAHGFLTGSGSTDSGSLSISGYQTESNLNGYANAGSSPSACLGVAGAGGVDVP